MCRMVGPTPDVMHQSPQGQQVVCCVVKSQTPSSEGLRQLRGEHNRPLKDQAGRSHKANHSCHRGDRSFAIDMSSLLGRLLRVEESSGSSIASYGNTRGFEARVQGWYMLPNEECKQTGFDLRFTSHLCMVPAHTRGCLLPVLSPLPPFCIACMESWKPVRVIWNPSSLVVLSKDDSDLSNLATRSISLLLVKTSTQESCWNFYASQG